MLQLALSSGCRNAHIEQGSIDDGMMACLIYITLSDICRAHTTPLHAPQNLKTARLVSTGRRLATVVYVQLASVSDWISAPSPRDASRMRLCCIREHDAGLCSCGLLHARPVGNCAHAAGLTALPAVLARVTRHPPVVHAFILLHALQRRTPALMASAGRHLMRHAPVSGWITACSAGGCSFHDLTLKHKSSRQPDPGACAQKLPSVCTDQRWPDDKHPPPPTLHHLSATHHTGPHSAAPAACPSTQYRPTTCAACISE